MSNPYGDIELDPTEMRVLAHPVRLALLSRLQRSGPDTATSLSEHVGASPSVVSWHLRHLAAHGLVVDAEPPEGRERDGRVRWWKAAARGIRLTAPKDEPSEIAYRALSRLMMEQADELPGTWAAEIEPLLEPDWRALAGLSNTRILVGREELAELERRIQELLAPYVLRKDQPDPPAESRSVRMLHYTLPDAPDSSCR